MFNWFSRLVGWKDKNNLSRFQWRYRNLAKVDGKWRVEILEYKKNWIVYMSDYGTSWYSSDGVEWEEWRTLHNQVQTKELYKGR